MYSLPVQGRLHNSFHGAIRTKIPDKLFFIDASVKIHARKNR
jgi:hypothetical protein